MNITMQLTVAAAVCLCVCAALPEPRLARKSQRPTRGFKNIEMMTARGFGKRDHAPTRSEHEEMTVERRTAFKPNAKVLIARGYGKRTPDSDEVYGMDNFWETLESGAEKDGQGGDEKLESIPTDWFIHEMLNNPDFARSVVRKFIDLNQDGMLSTDELLRNVV